MIHVHLTSAGQVSEVDFDLLTDHQKFNVIETMEWFGLKQQLG
jgi:hypothetical protein